MKVVSSGEVDCYCWLQFFDENNDQAHLVCHFITDSKSLKFLASSEAQLSYNTRLKTKGRKCKEDLQNRMVLIISDSSELVH
jgi:hypothetical protein